MIRKLFQVIVALSMAVAIGAASTQPADARGGRTAAFVGGTLFGLGVLGAYAHARDRAYYGGCYKGPVRCEVVPGPCYYNRWGDYVCRRGVERCYRPTYCD